MLNFLSNDCFFLFPFSGENLVVVTLGANLETPPSRADELEHVIANSKMILCQYEIEHATIKRAFEVAKRNNGMYRNIDLVHKD